jgi:hypothetical protein
MTLNHRIALTMIIAAGLAIAGFTALGSIFDYPKILKQPTADILASFHAHETAVIGWFLVLVVGAALLAPLAIMIARTTSGRRAHWIAGLGVAAAVVQVVGLSRWALWVPGISDDALDPTHTTDAYDRFHTLHVWLGTAIGETVGYALTAGFTALAAHTLRSSAKRDWLAVLGYTSAALIATGVLIPAGLDVARVTSFVGYIAWSAWLLIMAVRLWRAAPAVDTTTTTPRAPAPQAR